MTGAHNVKVGVADQFGRYRRYNNANADLYQTYQNGVPLRVTSLNTPLEVQENLDANFGVYAQDSWNMGKLTLNYGARFDYLKQSIVGQKAQVGRFANIAAYDDIALPVWKDFSPRMSAVYNLSGDGKTAVRVGYNKFVTAQTTGFAQLYNPTALTTPARWRGPTSTATTSPMASVAAPVIPTRRLRDQLRRPAVELRRALAGAVRSGSEASVSAGVQRRHHARSADRRDGCRSSTSAATSATSPCARTRCAPRRATISSRSPARSTAAAFSVWLPKPGVASQVANIDSTSDDMKRAYNGFDLSFNARMRGGIRAFGGFNLERTINDVCVSAASDPNRSLYCNQADSGIPWQKQFKATVVYPLPWQGITVSMALQSLNGYLSGTAAQAYGGFTAGTGFDNPRGLGTFWRSSPTTRYAAELQGRRARRARWCCRRWRRAAWRRSTCRWWRRKRSSRRASTRSTSRSASRSSSASSA